MTDPQIAQDLADRGVIQPQELHVWRCFEGYEPMPAGFGLNRQYYRTTRTLRRWAAKVRFEIAEERERRRGGKVRFGHTIASGSRTRFAADTTPTGGRPGSSWNEERIRAAMSGNQRKPAKPAPTARRKKAG